MSTPKVQIPAKRAPRRAAAGESYATPYAPPALAAPAAPAGVDAVLAGLHIEDGVPLPEHATAATKQDVMAALLQRMRLGQSVCLDFGYKSSLLKAVQGAHRAAHAAAGDARRYTVKRHHDAKNTIRVWRVA